MITALRFKREPSGVCGDRLVREAEFERITDLPLSTVCLAANRARDRLSNLLGRELTLDVFAPALVRSGMDAILFGNGVYYVAKGAICTAYIVFRDRDGHRLAASAFGEDARDDEGALSTLERRALERIAQEVATFCEPICGEVERVTPGTNDLDAPQCVTYFELRIANPIDAVIGIGLSRDPGPAFGTSLDRSMLDDVALDVRAEFGRARIDAFAVARWDVGTTVVLETKIGAPTSLLVGDVILASGDCGIRADNNAVSITSIAAPLLEESAT